jgi:signal peptidase I
MKKNQKEENVLENKEKKDPRDVVRNFFKELVPYIIIIFVVATIRTFIATPVRVNGSSMYPTLKDGEILILNKMDRKFKRFDIVVADVSDIKVIKRVIGLPGENISYENCKLYINGKETEDFVKECITEDFSLENLYGYDMIPEGYYFVMGDNRGDSADSRKYEIGLIKSNQIQGKATFRIFPFKVFGGIK